VQNNYDAPDVVYIWGSPGCGKDKYVDQHYPINYDVPESDGYKWKDGYNHDSVVVYRNIGPSTIKHKAGFLKELDRRACQVPVKGGFVTWKPDTILMTTIHSPEAMAEIFDHAQEFLRRITRIVNIDELNYMWQILQTTPDYLSPYDW